MGSGLIWVAGIWYLVSGIWYLVSGIWYLVSAYAAASIITRVAELSVLAPVADSPCQYCADPERAFLNFGYHNEKKCRIMLALQD